MKERVRAGRMTGRRKLFSFLASAAGAIAVLFYFEHVSVIYIAAAVAAGVVLLLAGFRNLNEAAIHATEEAYRTRKSEGVFLAGEVEACIADDKGLARPKPAAAVSRAG